MGMRHLALFVGLLAQGSITWAQATRSDPPSVERQLRGLDDRDATALLAKLETAQQGIRAGEFQPFELLAGSIASYDKTTVSPRDAFLQVPFEQVWSIERISTDNPLWQPYRLSYAPDGLGRLYWDIEVVLNANGDIQRVVMLYKPPAPF